MSLKKRINDLLGRTGYQLTRKWTVESEARSGRLRWLRSMGCMTVIDVGAHTGAFAEKMRVVFPKAMIYAFEPLRSCFDELHRRSALLGPMECFPLALGRTEGVVELRRHSDASTSSLLVMAERTKQAFPRAAEFVSEEVRIRRLDDVLAAKPIARPALLKIDVQGSELEVLSGGESVLRQCDVALIEVSFVELYQRQPLFDALLDHMRSRGFSYHGSLDQMEDPHTGEILQADALFLRN